MPKADTSSTTSRCALLASAALAAPASLLPAIAAAAGQDPTLPEADARSDRRCRRLEAVRRSLDTSYDPVVRGAVAEVHACIEEAGRLPASTLAGLLVKARIVHDEVTMGSTLCADGVAESLVADLERLAEEAVA